MKNFFILLMLSFMLTSIQTQAQIGSRLIAHFPFSGNVNDVAGTLTGTAGNVTFVNDRFGNANSACSFTTLTSRSYIDYGNNLGAKFSGSANFSISIWFKRSTTSRKMTLFSKHANATYCGLTNQQVALLLTADGTLQLNYYQDEVATNYDATISKINDTDWHHVVVTYDASPAAGQDRTEFYVDNVLQPSVLTNNGTNVTAISNNDAHLAIGHVLDETGTRCANTTYGSDGVIDDVRLYDRLVTVCDVRELFMEGILLSGPIACYPFSGNANDGVTSIDGLVTNATPTTDRFGNPNSAYTFTNSGNNRSFIDFGNNFNNTLSGVTGKFSISIWFKKAANNSKMTLFSKHANATYCGTTAQQVALLMNTNGKLQLNYYQGTAAANYDATINTITDTDWHHVVVTYDASLPVGQDRTEFYVDNVLWPSTLSNNGTNVTAISGNAAHAAVGHVLTTGGGLCSTSLYGSDGDIDDFYLYNRVLSPCDVDTLFVAPTLDERAVAPTGLASTLLSDYGLELTIHPNPVKAVLYLNLEAKGSTKQDLTVQIISITGQVLESRTLPTGSSSIPTQELAAGIYFVSITDGVKVIETQKFIKQ